MKAKEIMSSPVVTVTADASLKNVADVLIEHDISAVPVLDERQNLIGIVTESDLVRLERTPDSIGQIRPIRARQVPHIVRDVMSRDVFALPEDADVAWIAELMISKHVHQNPIVRGEQVVGIVARSDVLRILTRTDDAIEADLQRLIDEDAAVQGYVARVAGGNVTLTGPSDKMSRRAASILARTVAGVLEVTFN